MKKHLFKVLALPCLFLSHFSFSQNNASKSDTTVESQITVMVIPRTNETEDIKTVLDHAIGKRIAVAKVKDAFQKRGYNMIDYFTWLNDVKAQVASISGNDSHVTAKSVFTNLMQPDFKVEVDCAIMNDYKDVNRAFIHVECYDPATMLVLARSNEECFSIPNRTHDTALLVINALKNRCIENFLDDIEKERQDEIKNGHPIKIYIEASNSSNVKLFTKIDSQTVGRIIIQWVKNHMVSGECVENGSTSTFLGLDNVRIPYFNDRNRVNKPAVFGNALVAYLNDKGIVAEIGVSGGAVYINLKSLK